MKCALIALATAFYPPIAAPALAESTATAAPSPDADPAKAGEIVVTARKRTESLINVPVAVTAVTEQAIRDKGIASVANLTNTVPNVSFSEGGGDSGIGAAVIFIRGVGQNDYVNSSDPGVGTYVDGVYLGRTIGGSVELPDIAQVEVLRGPQGTLFGKNTIGGAINITSKRPSFANGGSVQLTAGERSRVNLDAEGDLRLSDKLALHGSVATRNADGYVRRLNGGAALGGEESYMGRLKAEYRASDRWNILLAGDYASINATTPRVVTSIDPTNSLALLWNNVPPALIANIVSGGFVPVNPALGFTPYAVTAGQPIDNRYARTDLRSTNAGGSYDYSFEGGGISARIEGKLSDAFTVRSITAYRGFTSVSNSDQDGQSVDWGQVRYTDRQEQFSQEINLLGTLLDGRLDYIVGGYYFREVAKAYQNIRLANPILLFENDFSTRTSSYAGFGEVNYKLLDKLTLTAGIRYSNEPKRFNAVTACLPGMVLPVCNPQGYYLPPTQVSATFDSTDPHAGLRYQFSHDFMAYFSFSRGFKSGGFNARANTQAQVLPYRPEHVSSYEIGTKGNVAHGLFTYSVAAFYYDYSDLQVTATGTDAVGNSLAFVGNIDARVKGMEGEFTVHPVHNLILDGSIGYLDDAITRVPASLAAFFTASGLRSITLSNKLPKTPELTFNIGAQLTTPLTGLGEIKWRLDYAHVSSQFSDIQNFAITRSPAHGNLNARISFTPDHGRVTLALYAKNLTDETYLENGFYPNGGAGAQVLVTPNRPREVGGSIRVAFGN